MGAAKKLKKDKTEVRTLKIVQNSNKERYSLRELGRFALSPEDEQFVQNLSTARARFFEKFANEEREIDEECGYPKVLEVSNYQDMLDREGIASRINNLYPNECWTMPPDIYENEALDKTTPFEDALNELLDNDDINLMAKMETLDKVSGYGRFGIMLLGFDDKKENLATPLAGIDKFGKPTGKGGKINLVYAKVLPEMFVSVKRFQNDSNNPRYGKPTFYSVKIVNLEDIVAGEVVDVDLIADETVHWSRVIHVAEEADVYGIPRLQRVYNRCYDLRKILGSAAEGYWKGSFPGLSIETHPTSDIVQFDEDAKQATKDQVELYQKRLQRYLATAGVTVKSLESNVAEPTQQFRTQMEAIAVAMDVPMRVLMGSEEGKQASTQDARRWNRQLSKRQRQHITPVICRPTINRITNAGALPNYKKLIVKWADLNAPTENDRAVTAQKITDSLMKYIQSQSFLLMRPKEFLVNILGYPLAMVLEILKAAGGENAIISKLQKAAEKQAKQMKPVGSGKTKTKSPRAAR